MRFVGYRAKGRPPLSFCIANWATARGSVLRSSPRRRCVYTAAHVRRAVRLKVLDRLARRLRVESARDFAFVPGGTRSGATAQHLLVVAARKSPTIDYYLSDLFAGDFASSHRVVVDSELERWSGAAATAGIAPGTRVVLVRMPDSRWASVIEAAGDKVVEVVWLIDDDAIAAREDEWLPKDYRMRLLDDHLAFKQSFERLVDRVWASTSVLAARFPPARVDVRPPRALPRSEQRWVKIFYHGTGSHQREHAFLLPILHEVQTRLPYTVFEVTGDHALYRMFRTVPRLRVLHPVAWPDYWVHLQASNYDLGLAPLLDTPFNRARSGVKALEVAATGARGLLSRRAPYTEYAHLPGMLLVGDEPSEWVDAIVRVAEDLVSSR